MIKTLIHEIREVCRLRIVRQHPGFSAAVVLSLAIGISGAAAIFAIVESARYGPMPFANAARLEHLYLTRRSNPDERRFEIPRDVAQRLAVPDSPIEAVAEYQLVGVRVRRGDSEQQRFSVRGTPNLLTLLGAHAAVGRLFAPTDDDGSSVVLSYEYWQSEFSHDRDIVGRTITVDGTVRTIIGVTARTDVLVNHADIWEPDLEAPGVTKRDAGVRLLALMRPGVGGRTARPRIAAMATAALAASHGDIGDTRVESLGFRDFLLANGLEATLLILTIIAVFVALVAAVNFAALLLARGIRRRGEIGVRAALGASVPRLAREIVGECVVLCAIGGTLAAFVAPAIANALGLSFQSLLPGWVDVTIGWRTVAASVAAAVVVGVVFGLGPAFDIARPALTAFLGGASGTTRESGGLARTRASLVAIQVALATSVLVAIGSLLGRAIVLGERHAGFDPAPLIGASVRDTARAGTGQSDMRLNAVLFETRMTPGVAAAAYRVREYLYQSQVSGDASVSAPVTNARQFAPPVWLHRISDGFFSTLRPRLIAGRFPTDDEIRRGDGIVVVTRSVASEMYADNAVGRVLHTGRTAWRIVGVVEDIREYPSQNSVPQIVFVPLTAGDLRGAGVAGPRELLVRSSAHVPATLRLLDQRLVRTHVAGVDVSSLESIATRMRDEMRAFRQVARVLTSIFVVALALAALGIGGLVSYTAEARSRELAIREALGATRWHVAGRVLRGAFVQATAGVAGGALLATALIEYLNGFALRLTAPVGTTAIALVLVSLTVIAASLGPIARAWRRDLAATLRV